MERTRILQAWRDGGYQPSKGLRDTVASIEAGPYGEWIKLAAGAYLLSSDTDPKAIDDAANDAIPARRIPHSDWLVIIAGVLLSKKTRLAGRHDSEYVRRRLAKYLTVLASRHDDGTGTLPETEAKPRAGRRGSVEPPKPEPEPPAVQPQTDDDDELPTPSGMTWH